MSGATTYTIINDVTSVAKKLPRFPTLESAAILRHVNGKKFKDYSYRLFHVKSALMWLKENNHLYKDIIAEYPDHLEWDDIAAVAEIPYLPLTDNDIRSIDDTSMSENDNVDETENLTGMCKYA